MSESRRAGTVAWREGRLGWREEGDDREQGKERQEVKGLHGR